MTREKYPLLAGGGRGSLSRSTKRAKAAREAPACGQPSHPRGPRGTVRSNRPPHVEAGSHTPRSPPMRCGPDPASRRASNVRSSSAPPSLRPRLARRLAQWLAAGRPQSLRLVPPPTEPHAPERPLVMEKRPVGRGQKQRLRARLLGEPAQLDTHSGSVRSFAATHWRPPMGHSMRWDVATQAAFGGRRVGTPQSFVCGFLPGGEPPSPTVKLKTATGSRYRTGRVREVNAGGCDPPARPFCTREGVDVRRPPFHLGLDLGPVVQVHGRRHTAAAPCARRAHHHHDCMVPPRTARPHA